VLQRRTARAIAPRSNEAQSLLVVNIAGLTLAPTWVAFRGVLFTNSYDVNAFLRGSDCNSDAMAGLDKSNNQSRTQRTDFA
jgi:hypothetical protein